MVQMRRAKLIKWNECQLSLLYYQLQRNTAAAAAAPAKNVINFHLTRARANPAKFLFQFCIMYMQSCNIVEWYWMIYVITTRSKINETSIYALKHHLKYTHKCHSAGVKDAVCYRDAPPHLDESLWLLFLNLFFGISISTILSTWTIHLYKKKKILN